MAEPTCITLSDGKFMLGDKDVSTHVRKAVVGMDFKPGEVDAVTLTLTLLGVKVVHGSNGELEIAFPGTLARS